MVLTQGRPRVINSIVDEIDGIILAYQPGCQGANAVADVLFGEYNPSGVLPFTYPRYTGDIMHYDYKFSSSIQQRTPSVITYNGYNPQWPFGFGLSYTSFKTDSITLSSKTLNNGDTLIVTIPITNTGSMDGSKCVDLFISDEYSSISPANKKLKSFTKIELASGESLKISFNLTADDFAFVNDFGERILEKGNFFY